MERIGQGNTAEVFAYGEGKVLKLARPGIPAHIITNEFNIIKALNQTTGLAPTAYTLIEADGRTGAIYERIQGKTLLEELEQRPWRTRTVGREMARCQHTLLTATVSLPLPTVAQRLTAQIQHTSHLTTREKAQVLRVLSTLPSGTTLCHYDLHPGNIMRAESGKLYMIDWANACLGPPAADICRTDTISRYGTLIGASPLLSLMIRTVRGTYRRAWQKELNKLLPIPKDIFAAWRLPIMAARLDEAIGDMERETLLKRIKALPLYTGT